jgi:hypothetical protein
MLGGISTRWKQTVAYYYTGSSVNGGVLKNIVLSIIKYTEEIGLKVNSVTSDMGAINQAMWKSFNISCSKSGSISSSIKHPCDPTRTIDFLADVPHLLKNIRNSLLCNKHFIITAKIQEKYKLQSPIIDSKHLNKLVDFQEGMDLKFAYKLTSEHLDEKHFNKMKVSRATSVINHDVSCGLKFVANEIKDDSILTTAWFIGIVDKWFTLMTSRNPGMALSMKNNKVYNETITFLNEVIEIFRGLKILGKTGKIRWKPIQSGVILSTTSVINLQNKFLLEKNFDFLMTSRFTQDCLENLFSLVRAKQVIPTALQFKNNLKLICVAQFLKKSSKGSYDIDDRQFLSGFLDIVNSKVHKPQQRECIVLPKDWDKTSNLILSNAEQNCLFNIAGYIISRVKKIEKVCTICFESLVSKNRVNAGYTKFVTDKEHKVGSLFFANETTFALFLQMELIFRSFEPYLNSQKNCNTMLLEKINSDEQIKSLTLYPNCHQIKLKLENRFITFRLKIFSLKKKRLLCKKKKTKKGSCELGSKSMTMHALALKV